MVEIEMTKSFKNLVDWFSIKYDKEIAGWIVGTIESNKIICEDLLFPEQEANAGGVEMSGKQIVKLRKEYGKGCQKIIGEWHSHHGMGAFWSGIDDDFIKEFMKPRKIGLFIVSSKGSHLIRVELREPIHISANEIPYSVELDKEDEKLKLMCEKILKEKVKEPKVVICGGNYDYTCYGRDGLPFAGRRDWSISPEQRNTAKKLNQELASMVCYHNDNSISIRNIDWYTADELAEEYRTYSPLVECLGEDEARVKFSFKDKKEALEFMKEIKEDLREFLEERMIVLDDGMY